MKEKKQLTPKGRESIFTILTGYEAGTPEQHLALYEQDAQMYRAGVLFLIAKRAHVRQHLVPKAIALAISKLDREFYNKLLTVATALDMRDAIRLIKKKTFGVTLTSERQNWVKEFFQIQDPIGLQWQVLTGGNVLTEIADLAHPKPSDWAGLAWLAHAAYGAQPLEGSPLARAREFRKLVRDNPKAIEEQRDYLESVNMPWHYIRGCYGTVGGQIKVPSALLDTIIKRFSARGIIANIDVFKGQETIIAQALGSSKGYVPFTLPLSKYLELVGDKSWGSIPMALLMLAQKQFDKVYINEDLGKVVVAMDVSSSMGLSIQLASIIAALIASKVKDVEVYTFGPGIRKLNTPTGISHALDMMRMVKSRGMTDIGELFRLKQVQDANTLVIVSDGWETAGPPAVEFIRKIKCDRVIYIKVGKSSYEDCIKEGLDGTEINWKMVQMSDISQLDLILPMLAYDEVLGDEDTIRLMHDYLMGIPISGNICAACHEEIDDYPVYDEGYVFHMDCLKNWWDLLGSNRRKIWKCDHCNANITGRVDECPNCGGTFQKLSDVKKV
jgi:hypothetical protein